jgi:hypothetical protein
LVSTPRAWLTTTPLEATALQDRLERIKWRLWHGDADKALNRARELAEDVAALASGYPGLARLVKVTAGLVTYIGNNTAAIADYAQRWDHGEIISTAFAESTVDLVVSRRFAKKQQMQWSKAVVKERCPPPPADPDPHPRRHAARPVHQLVSGHASQRCPARPTRCRSLNCPTVSGALVVYQFGELDEVSLAFSTTIHKSQGSEYPAVVIPVGMTHYMMLRRNLIYTGVTRGKKLVVLVGQRKAIGIAVRSAEGGRRWSKLRELLESAVGNRAAHLT